jgi:multiple sugar transport system substrate-binding protein
MIFSGGLSRHRVAVFAGLVAGAAAVLIPLATSPREHAGGCPSAAQHNGLTVASGADVSLTGERRALIELWNRAHPDARASLVEISSVADLQRSQMAAVQQSHSCDYDVLVLDAPLTAEFAESGAITPYPLPQGWDNDFLPGLKQSVTWKGTVYALPFNADVGLLYYWNDARSAPPVDLNDLLVQAAEVAGHHFATGYSMQFGDYEGATVNALELIWGFHGDVMRDDQVVIGRPEIRAQVAEAVRALRNATASGGTAVGASAQNATEASSIRDFVDHKVAFMRNWPYAFRVLAADPRMRDAAHHLRFGVSPLPGPTVLGGQNLAISAYSRQKQLAGQLIDFLTDPQHESRLFGCGGFAPTRTSAYEHPQPCPGSSSAEQQISQSELTQLGEQIQRALENARLRPATPSYQDFSEALRGCVRSAIFSGTEIDYGGFAGLLRNAFTGRAVPGAGAGTAAGRADAGQAGNPGGASPCG